MTAIHHGAGQRACQSPKPYYRDNGKMWDSEKKIKIRSHNLAKEGHQAGGPIEEEEVKSQLLVLQGRIIRGGTIGTCHYLYPATTKLSL